MIKRWKWTADDQNFVANLIAGQHMDPAKAAEKWVKANPGKVKAWLGQVDWRWRGAGRRLARSHRVAWRRRTEPRVARPERHSVSGSAGAGYVVSEL